MFQVSSLAAETDDQGAQFGLEDLDPNRRTWLLLDAVHDRTGWTDHLYRVLRK